MILTIDPGRSPGFAWSDLAEKELAGCGTKIPDIVRLEAKRTKAILEYPQITAHTPDANDIVRLAFIAGTIGGHLVTLGIEVREVYPVRWKGNLQKWMHHPRIIDALKPHELSIVEHACGDLVHYAKVCKTRRVPDTPAKDILDAVGLLLWSLGRPA